MAHNNQFEAHYAQLKPFLTERRTVDVSRRVFWVGQLRPLTEITTSPRQSPSQSV